MKLKYLFPLVLTALIAIAGCEKVEGEGGKATITGKVIELRRERIQNSIIAEYDAMDVRVYIIYGDDEIPISDDDVRTTFNGMYKFENLFPGKYTVYTYSECQMCAQGQEPVIKQIEIGKNQTEIEVEPMYINNY